MTERTTFTHAVANPAVRRDIARAVRDGIGPRQLAAEFGIRVADGTPVRGGVGGAQRTIRQLDSYERETVIHACRQGGRRRWEQELGVEVVRELLDEE